MKELQAQGQLLTAVSAGGANALLRLADKKGSVGDLAREALDKMTRPGAKCTPIEAINSIMK